MLHKEFTHFSAALSVLLIGLAPTAPAAAYERDAPSYEMESAAEDYRRDDADRRDTQSGFGEVRNTDQRQGFQNIHYEDRRGFDNDRHDDRHDDRRGYDARRGYDDRRGYDERRGYDDWRSYRRHRHHDGQYFRYRDHRCGKGTTGLVLGAIFGSLLGRSVAGRDGDQTAGAIIGGGAGALAGRAIDRSDDRCRRH